MKAIDKPLAKQFIQKSLQLTKIQTISRMQYARVQGKVDGRVRTIQQPFGTNTGRLNSKGQTKGREWWPEQITNLQNITNPKKFPSLNPLFNVRKIIIPDPGHCFVAADYSAAELYAYLAEAGDHERIEMLHAGEDLHAHTAAHILDVDIKDLTYEQRALGGKFPNFALGYGGGWQMLKGKINKDSDLTGISVDAKMAKHIVDEWRAINPKVVRWWQQLRNEVSSGGVLTNAYGRRRIFLGRKDSAGNDWIAFLPQSNIADHLNHSLNAIYFRHDPKLLQVMLQVHDEILTQTKIGNEYKVAKVLRAEMQRPLVINEIEVKIPVEVSVGYENWGTMKEMKL